MKQITEHYWIEEYADEIYMVSRLTDRIEDTHATGIIGEQTATAIAIIFEMMEKTYQNKKENT